MKILMVCLGNICRSPLAEGILKHKIRDHGLDWEIDSAGTGAWHIGEGPDPRSVAVAHAYGVDITGQRARQIRGTDLDYYDLILTMDQSNYQDVRRLAREQGQAEKVRLIMDFAEPGAKKSVPDPYWDDNGFENVYRMLEKACDRLIEHFRDQAVR